MTTGRDNMQTANQTKSVVYVIGPANQHRVKIGTTEHIDKRPRTIQSMSPVPLQVLWTTPGNRQLEDALHEHFKDRRTHGEWFDFPDVNAVREIQWAVKRLEDPAGRGQTPDEGVAALSRGAERFYEAMSSAADRGMSPEDLSRMCWDLTGPMESISRVFDVLANHNSAALDADTKAGLVEATEAACAVLGALHKVASMPYCCSQQPNSWRQCALEASHVGDHSDWSGWTWPQTDGDGDV